MTAPAWSPAPPGDGASKAGLSATGIKAWPAPGETHTAALRVSPAPAEPTTIWPAPQLVAASAAVRAAPVGVGRLVFDQLVALGEVHTVAREGPLVVN